MKAWFVALFKRMTFMDWTIVAAAALFVLGVVLQAAAGNANCGRAVPLRVRQVKPQPWAPWAFVWLL